MGALSFKLGINIPSYHGTGTDTLRHNHRYRSEFTRRTNSAALAAPFEIQISHNVLFNDKSSSLIRTATGIQKFLVCRKVLFYSTWIERLVMAQDGNIKYQCTTI